MRSIFIDEGNELLRIVILENGVMNELFFKEKDEIYPGEIYKGVVKNIVPAIKSAFIDIGINKKAYMYIDSKFKNTRLRKGDEVLVQVVKENLGKKAAKVTNYIDVPGKYCVLNTFNKGIKFSKKIVSSEFKKTVCENLCVPKDLGVTIRTAAENISVNTIQKELNKLYKIYNDVVRKARYSVKPELIFDNGGLVQKVLRDRLEVNDFKIFTNSRKTYEDVVSFLKEYGYDENRVEFCNEFINIHEYSNIEKDILALRNRKVYLKCGGYIVIDRTEAMYVVDVNSGKNIKNKHMENTVLTTNIQAAEEISRQVRLRNLSGIILIDFIDMDNDEMKNRVMDTLKKGFSNDKNKTVIYPFTDLNLIQIARKRSGRSIVDYIDEDCKLCDGKGRRIKFSYISMLICNKIKKIQEKNIHLQIGNAYKENIQQNKKRFLESIGALDKNIYLTYGRGEYFKVEPLVFSNQVQSFSEFKVEVEQ